MDELEKDLWNLSKKYHLNIDYLRLKIEQMQMEYELACDSGIAFVEYQGEITLFDKQFWDKVALRMRTNPSPFYSGDK